jgi:predicted DNA-binding transcriptional regulator AlpA
MNRLITEKLTLTKKEFAEHLGVSTKTIDRLRASGKLPLPLPSLHHPRWSRAVILRWLESGIV